MVFVIRHRTCYRYSEKVRFGVHRLMLRPREEVGVRVLDFDLILDPNGEVRWGTDVFGNWIGWVEYGVEGEKLEFISVSRVRVDEVGARQRREGVGLFPFVYDVQEHRDLQPYIDAAYPEERIFLRQWMKGLWRPMEETKTVDLLMRIKDKVHQSFSYQRREEMGVQSPKETLDKGSGSCRDFAVFLMEAYRFLGLAARFVSGYAIPKAVVKQAGMSTHAWVEVYLPDEGWIGVDPTVRDEREYYHVTLATTRNASQAATIKGAFAGKGEAFLGMDVDVSFERVC
ncbi:MAG: transglutaminase family protein [Methylacidiphilales bacterium]|nr:transglutaminase family protein [Candidatus Methylacidiphilales bacterium]MDW8349870.1 transglutaminase family protein [Verrucomicrobiae bacterium]